MLTPMDIQQKRFHVGIGFEKKDVNSFMEEVLDSYERLYRSNADLKERVSELEDKLQNYKSKEASLEKSIMLAEKESEDKKSNASKEAKNIELDAKNKAKIIVEDAEKKLVKMQKQTAALESQYELYKSSFLSLMKSQYEFLKSNDFDGDSMIDPSVAGMLIGFGVSQAAPNQGGNFGEYSGDPQMRDESTLGGFSGGFSGGMSMDADAKATSSEVYTSLMNDNENFVDPFNPKQENGRYNPYDGRTNTSSSKKAKSSFTVAESGSGKNRKPKQTGTKTTKSTVDSATKKNAEKAPTPSVKIDEEEEKVAVVKDVNQRDKQENKQDNKQEKDKSATHIEIKEELPTENNQEVKETVEEETSKTIDEVTSKAFEDEVSNSGEEKASNSVDEMSEKEESQAKKKAMEFFKKANEHSDEKETDNSDEYELIGEVEDNKHGNTMLIGDGEEESDEDFSFEFEFE